MEKEQKYYLGLDIGTNSVGWCVTDQNYNIIKKHKKVLIRNADGTYTNYTHLNTKGKEVEVKYGNHLWGSRLFEEAHDAKSRRLARSNRRRLARRRYRLVLLQDIFRKSGELEKVNDPYFFERLNNSALHKEDRNEKYQLNYLLFNGQELNDVTYFKKYPTIYHLRKDIINNPDKKFDIREIYLALAHMIKYRGNFLSDADEYRVDSDNTLHDSFNAIDELCLKLNKDAITFNIDKTKEEKLIEIFKEETKKSLLTEKIKNQFSNKVDKLQENIIKLISGSQMEIGALFKDIFELDNEDSGIQIELDKEAFLTDKLLKLKDNITENGYNLILEIKKIYDFRILVNLLQGGNSISDAMVTIYDNHKQELKELKELVRRYSPAQYNMLFKKIYIVIDKGKKVYINNYVNYIGFTEEKNKKIRLPHKAKQDDFYKTIKNVLDLDNINKESFEEKQIGDKVKLNEIKDKIDLKKYLLRQNSSENGVLPYQLNKSELRAIINNQSKFYPFLKEDDNDFLHPGKKCYKIESILTYRIPYYVGPVAYVDKNKIDSTKNNFSWSVRKEGAEKETVTPWNFYDVIDVDKSAEEFLNNLRNKCTYLIQEETLPKCSLIYQMYQLLNELNKLVIEFDENNFHNITKEEKERLIKNVYLVQKNPKKKDLEKELNAFHNCKNLKLTSTGTLKGKTGITSDDLVSNLKAWVDMKDDEAFGEELLKNKNYQQQAEKIIYYITSFEDKKVLEKRLKDEGYSDNKIKYFKSLNYTGWARLSNKLLNGLTIEDENETGEKIDRTIIDIMYNTNLNFMEIYETKDGKYSGFKRQVEDIVSEQLGTKTDAEKEEYIIENSYVSPLMKRSLHQTIGIVKELKKILKVDHFDKYFVESTRRDAEKKRTNSRKKQIIEYYKDIKNSLAKQLEDSSYLTTKDLKELENELNNKTKDDDKILNSKKLFLYFMQMGKSVYTGEPIDLDLLEQNYDIDHIIPKAYVKDDSFVNTVLVERGINNRKKDKYPFNDGTDSIITKKGQGYVKFLNSINPFLMPDEKKKRILRNLNKKLTDDEISSFVKRQLVTTD